MKTISIAEFETLIQRQDWQREQDIEVVERTVRNAGAWGEEVDVTHVWGWASLTSTVNGVKITYTETFSYDEYDPESLTTGTEGLDKVWSIEGVVVVDEERCELDAHDLADYLNEDFSSIDYSILEIEKTIDIDVDENEDGMETFTLEINNEPNIRFTGERIASAYSTDDQAMGSSYSGQTGRWTELYLYRTRGGKYICHQIDRTRWQGEKDHFSGKVCETLEEVKEFFGYNWLAKELYAEAGIDEAVDVE